MQLIRRKLLGWYDRHRRDLPWRRSRDPYAIWVSEVMLQQTQVKTVLGHYARFLERFPTLSALAKARDADVLHAWQGLGYYSRARRLHAAARAVRQRHGGRIPHDRATLLELPGVGAYSAGAVASIAFGERVPVVDGNVVRVLTRLFALRGDPGRAPLKARLWELAAELVPVRRPGDFNQALMELGATVCSPRDPACERCPLARECKAHALGGPARFPELSLRPRPTAVRVAAVVVKRNERVLVVRVPDDEARWAGLHVFPHVTLNPNERAERGAERAARAHGVHARIGAAIGTSRYTITRFRMTLEAFEASAERAAPGRFYRLSELSDLAMPAPHRRLANALAERTATTGSP
ncbi:MAG TPA: A/G-specific adenine glycosylase [Polyangiaceae bacterium]|nr:A/G-specific adenine glycosylase [Polyangiaceae bacterium]